MRIRLLLLIAAMAASFPSLARGVYQAPEDFLRDSFAADIPSPQVIWLSGSLRTQVEKILGHPYHSLRVRYWLQGEKSAWILDEVGKDLPITTGIVIHKGRIERIKVLVFRESRGWEVRYPFFTDQYKDTGLVQDNDLRLDRRIDNISGATLSVRAVTKQARLALLLDQYVNHSHAVQQ